MLIDLNYVEFKNFLCFGNKTQKIEFHKGINIVQGFNKETQKRNSSGKTSFLQTILFGLYGRVSKDLNKKQLVNWKNKKNCIVKICFSKGEDEFVILRGLKPDFLKIVKNGEEQEQLSQKRDLQKYIEEEILCMDYITFSSLIHCNSNSSQSIFDVPKKEKRKFLENLFNLQTYSRILKACNKKIKKAEENISDIEKNIGFSKKTIEDLESQISNFKSSLSKIDLNSYKTEISDINRFLKEIEEEYKDSKNINQDGYINEINEISEYISKETKIENKINLIFQTFKVMFKDIDEKDINNEIQNELEDIKTKISTLTNELNNIDESELLNKISLIGDSLNNKKETAKNISNDINVFKGKLISLPDINELSGQTICPTCMQEIDVIKIEKDINEKKKDINESIINKQKELLDVEAEIKFYEEALKEHKGSLDLFNKKKIELNDLTKELQLKEFKQVENEKRIKLYEKKIRYKRAEEKLVILRDKITLEIDTYKVKLEELKSGLSKKEEFLIKTDRLKSKKKNLEERLKDLKKQYIEIQNYLNENEKKITQHKSEIKEYTKKRKNADKILDYLEYIKTLCSDEAVKQYAISNLIPYINKQANNYISEAGFEFYLKLDNLLDVEIKGPGIDEASFGNLSGGECKCTNLAMQLAFLDICKIQNPVFPNILLFDEILDSAIDSDGIDKILQIIRKKQKTDDLKVFIISHRSEIGSIEFDKLYKAEMERGFSVINEIL